MHPHMLRHTYVTTMLDAQAIDLLGVQGRAGRPENAAARPGGYRRRNRRTSDRGASRLGGRAARPLEPEAERGRGHPLESASCDEPDEERGDQCTKQALAHVRKRCTGSDLPTKATGVAMARMRDARPTCTLPRWRDSTPAALKASVSTMTTSTPWMENLH